MYEHSFLKNQYILYLPTKYPNFPISSSRSILINWFNNNYYEVTFSLMGIEWQVKLCNSYYKETKFVSSKQTLLGWIIK